MWREKYSKIFLNVLVEVYMLLMVDLIFPKNFFVAMTLMRPEAFLLKT